MLIKMEMQRCIQSLDRYRIRDKPQVNFVFGRFYIYDRVMDSFLIQTIRKSRYKTKWIGPVMLLREKRKAFQAWEFSHEPLLWVALYEHSKCKFY